MPAISIIMPVYEAEDFIDKTMQSLVDQSFGDFEIIAVDDGSTDSSLKLLKAWEEKDPRIHVFTEENSGPGVARNLGLEHATGDYLLFLDPDDVFYPNMLQAMYGRATESDADIVICASTTYDYQTGKTFVMDHVYRADLIPEKQPFSAKDIPNDIFRITVGWPWDKFIKRDFVLANSLKYPDLKNSEDGVFVFPALLLASKMVTLPEVQMAHTVNRSESLSFTREGNAFCFCDAIRMIKESMERIDPDGLYQRSFLNWAMDNCLWNLRTACKGDQEPLFEYLRDTMWPELGFLDHDEDYYYKKRDYRDAVFLGDIPVHRFYLLCEMANKLDDVFSSRAYKVSRKLAKPLRKVRDVRQS